MNPVSQSAAQFAGGGMQDEQAESWRQQPLERQGSFGPRLPPNLDTSRDAVGEPDEMDKLKAKLMSAWNNVKYGWAVKSKTSFNKISPVTVLGHSYQLNSEDEVERFRLAFVSRIWLTYRKEFPQLEGSTWTTDCGWGCMLRAGQMMLAQALALHFLGRDWTWSEALTLKPLDTETWTMTAAKRLVASLEASLQSSPGTSNNRPTLPPKGQASGSAEEADAHLKELYHRNLVSWFGDSSSAPLGLHRLVHLGLTMGKQAGDWYGPAVVAHILKKAVEEAMDPALAGITAYVSQDCTVYSADVIDCHNAAKAGQASGQASDTNPFEQKDQPESVHTFPDSRAVIILIPVRLGGERTNPQYFNFAKSILSLEYCIGIIGGKPKQACYFVGFQDDSLIYMDPHYCQSFVDVSTSNFPLQSYHCPSPKKMPFSKMDPSCTIGFYSRSSQDFERIREELSKVLQPSPKEKYPAFTFMQGHGGDYDLYAGLTPEKREWPFIRDRRATLTIAGDFVLL